MRFIYLYIFILGGCTSYHPEKDQCQYFSGETSAKCVSGSYYDITGAGDLFTTTPPPSNKKSSI
ncbi:hypothetical protein RGJ20_004801 [Serratia marcescens]